MLNKAQRKASKKIDSKLRTYGIACLWGQIRSGKTRAFLNSSKGYRTLVITKKNAIDGVKLEAKEIGVDVDVINYHSAKKVDIELNDYKLIILDECHLYISPATLKPSTIWKDIVKITKGKFIIFSSGTPTSEGYNGMFWLMQLSRWSPYAKYGNSFKNWFNDFGIPSKIWNGERLVNSYKKSKDDAIKQSIKHLVVTLTRKDTGHKYEAIDKIHNIPFSKQQTKIEKQLKSNLIYEKKGFEILADTPVKLNIKRHQLAGGIGINDENDKLFLFKKEPNKVKYIKKHFNPDTTIILSFYVHEQKYLADIFPHTGSVTKLSTGVDLSSFETMIIYSMSFSASNYEQVRGRLMNVNRKTQMYCHYLISGIDKHVLQAVKNKENFTRSWYEKNIKN